MRLEANLHREVVDLAAKAAFSTPVHCLLAEKRVSDFLASILSRHDHACAAL